MEIINDIKKSLRKLNIEGYLVGGCLRDRILGEKSKDIDIIVSCNIETLIKELENLGMNFFILNEKEYIYRAKFHDIFIDITTIKGGSVKSDLRKRDFSINSIAMSLKDDKIIDPENGTEDVNNKVLRTNDKERIMEDPIRILRGIRFAVKYGFKIEKKTSEIFKAAASEIRYSKKERKYAEFMEIIANDKEGICFSLMDQIGILPNIIPYANENKTIGKCKYHVEDALTHMITTYKTFRNFRKGKITLNADTSKLFTDKISCFPLEDYQAIAAFLHDIGKYLCYNNKNGRITFYNHQYRGEEEALKFLNDYGFPNKAKVFISKLILGHMEPLMLFKNKAKPKQYLKFFKNYEDVTMHIIILSFCDVYATRLYYDPDNEMELYTSFIENIYSEYLRYKQILLNPVIEASDLIKSKNLKYSEIKAAIDLINDKTYLGEIKNRNDALNIVKKGD